MKRKLSKLLLWVLAALLVVSLLPSAAVAATLNVNSIEKISVGNNAYGTDWIDKPLTSNGGRNYSATLSGDYNYVRIETVRWGMPMSYQSFLMDGSSPVTYDVLEYYDSNGSSVSVGSVIYGAKEYYIWRIPNTAATSDITITLTGSNGTSNLSCDITWEGGGSAAPTSPLAEVYGNDEIRLYNTDNTMEYKITGNNAWVRCGTEQLLAVGDTGIEVSVRYAGTSSIRASDAKILSTNREDAPTGITYSTATGIFTGVDSTMEYRIDSGIYIGITGTTLDISNELSTTQKTVYIRYKGITGLASSPCVQAIASIPLAPTTPSYTSGSYSISGVSTTMEIRVNRYGSWIACTGTTFDITSYISETASTTFEVRYKATSNNPASATKELTVAKLRKPPTGAYYIMGGSKIYGLKARLNYELNVYMPGVSAIDYTYTGTVASDGTCNSGIITFSGNRTVYRIRYVAQGGLAASPWIVCTKQ